MNILGIGPFELLIIFLVAFLFLGPDKLSKFSKDLKKAIENNDWIAIEKELMSKDKWLTNKDRRFREGDYLRKERLKRQKKEDTSFFFPDNGLMPKDIPV